MRTARLDTVEELLSHVGGSAAKLLRATAASLRASDSIQAEIDYVETFDLRRRSTMYLTYWTAGDTRNRGSADARVRRRRTATPVSNHRCGEAPDHLPVVLEFAATVDPVAGRRLLVEHRVPIDVLREALDKRIRRTRMPSPRCARRCRRPPTPTCDGRSGWRRPVPPPNRLVCNHLR